MIRQDDVVAWMVRKVHRKNKEWVGEEEVGNSACVCVEPWARHLALSVKEL